MDYEYDVSGNNIIVYALPPSDDSGNLSVTITDIQGAEKTIEGTEMEVISSLLSEVVSGQRLTFIAISVIEFVLVLLLLLDRFRHSISIFRRDK